MSITNETLWLNHVSSKLVHFQNKSDGTTFANLSFTYPDSASGYATVSLSEKQVKNSTKKDGSLINGFYNILLGTPDVVRQVSIKCKNGKYKKIPMTLKDISFAFANKQAA